MIIEDVLHAHTFRSDRLLIKSFATENCTILKGLKAPAKHHSFDYRPHSEGMGKVLFSQVSVCSHFRGKGYLPWMGGGVLTLDGGEVPTLGSGRGGVLTLDGEGGTYPGWWGGTYLGWGRGTYLGQRGGGTYFGWGEGVPTLDGGREYLSQTGEGYLPGMAGGGTYLGQIMLRAVSLLRLLAGGLSC